MVGGVPIMRLRGKGENEMVELMVIVAVLLIQVSTLIHLGHVPTIWLPL